MRRRPPALPAQGPFRPSLVTYQRVRRPTGGWSCPELALVALVVAVVRLCDRGLHTPAEQRARARTHTHTYTHTYTHIHTQRHIHSSSRLRPQPQTLGLVPLSPSPRHLSLLRPSSAMQAADAALALRFAALAAKSEQRSLRQLHPKGTTVEPCGQDRFWRHASPPPPSSAAAATNNR